MESSLSWIRGALYVVACMLSDVTIVGRNYVVLQSGFITVITSTDFTKTKRSPNTDFVVRLRNIIDSNKTKESQLHVFISMDLAYVYDAKCAMEQLK